MIRSRAEILACYAALVVFSIFVLVPFAGLILVAIRPSNSLGVAVNFSQGIHLDNFSSAWTQAGLGSALVASLVVSGFVAVVGTACAVMAGYALGALRFRGREAARYFLLVGLMVPVEATVVPLYYGELHLGLVNTYAAAFLPLTGLAISFGSFWMRAFFVSVPRELLDAAKVDGASNWNTLIRVLLPMARPAVLTMLILLFLIGWNDFLVSLVTLQTPDVQTAQVALAGFRSTFLTNDTLIAAGAAIVVCPVIVLFLLSQRRLIRGILAGGVKG
jgi:raffinose/stachyose/melibiose transport system permease protein